MKNERRWKKNTELTHTQTLQSTLLTISKYENTLTLSHTHTQQINTLYMYKITTINDKNWINECNVTRSY